MHAKTCGDCSKFLTKECPRAEYKDFKLNQAANLPTANPCEQFMLKKKERRLRPVYKDSGLVDEGYVEAIYHDNLPCFLVLKDKTFTILPTVSYNDKTFNPKEVKRIPYEPYGYFQGSIPNREELFWKVRREFQIFIDVEPIWLDVLSACVLLSYQQEKLLTVPYVYVYGDNESGKSTVLQLLSYLCYRPLYGLTVPAADIYGYLDDVDAIGCVLEDEIQGINRDIDKIKIYKAGYKKGAVVPRTLMTQFDRIIKCYNTFSFKAVASERIPSVKGFRERFIEISMVEGYPEKEWTDITKEDLDRLHTLRNMLLKWRMLSHAWLLPNPEVPMRGRLKEIWKPILQVTHGLTVFDKLLGFVETQRNERLATRQNTLEGHIVKVVTELHNQAKLNPYYIPFQTVWLRLVDDLDGKTDLNKPHVMDTAEFFRVTKNKVGYRLREVLSGKSQNVREKDFDGNSVVVKAYVFDQKKLRRIAKKYGYELVTKLSSLPTSERVDPLNSTLEDHGNNVEKGVDTPQKLSKLRNLVTKPLTIQKVPEGPVPLRQKCEEDE